MNSNELVMNLGQNLAYFGLGMLAAKRLRPYAKYFIIGGIAIAAAPAAMTLIEQCKQKHACRNQVEEVEIDSAEECCCHDEHEECCEEEHKECCEEKHKECCEEKQHDCKHEDNPEDCPCHAKETECCEEEAGEEAEESEETQPE
jgi:hypothetical protein